MVVLRALNTVAERAYANSLHLVWYCHILEYVAAVECIIANFGYGWREQCKVVVSLCRREDNECLLILGQKVAVKA